MAAVLSRSGKYARLSLYLWDFTCFDASALRTISLDNASFLRLKWKCQLRYELGFETEQNTRLLIHLSSLTLGKSLVSLVTVVHGLVAKFSHRIIECRQEVELRNAGRMKKELDFYNDNDQRGVMSILSHRVPVSADYRRLGQKRGARSSVSAFIEMFIQREKEGVSRTQYAYLNFEMIRAVIRG